MVSAYPSKPGDHIRNRRLLDEVRARFTSDDGRVARISLIEEPPPHLLFRREGGPGLPPSGGHLQPAPDLAEDSAGFDSQLMKLQGVGAPLLTVYEEGGLKHLRL